MYKVLIGGVLAKSAYVEVGAAELLPRGAGGRGRRGGGRGRGAKASRPRAIRRAVGGRGRGRVGRRRCRRHPAAGRAAPAAHAGPRELQDQRLYYALRHVPVQLFVSLHVFWENF